MLIDSFIGYLKAERNYSVHTLRAYARDLRSFQDYLARIDESLSFYNADHDLVRSWVASLMDNGAAPSSVCRRLSSLRTFYDYLRREGHAVSTPVKGLQGPKRRKKLPAFVKEEDMNSLIDDTDFGSG